MNTLERIRQAIVEHDAGSERSQQVEIGWSEMHDCRSYLAFRMAGEWETDDGDMWRAIVGTANHDWFRSALEKAFPNARFEVETSYRGVPGHADIVEHDGVCDLKFPTLSVAQSWRDPEAFEGKRVQVHGYAAGLVEAGDLTEDCLVRVLACPVDGGLDDWSLWEEPFDRSLADRAVRRLEAVRSGHVGKDKPYDWCRRFCGFFTVCRGEDEPRDDEPIVDPQIAAQINRYGELGDLIRPLDKEKKQLATELRGLRGVTAAGWRVSLTQPKGTKFVVDLDRVRHDYERSGVPLPEKEVPTSAPSLYVRRQK